MWDVPLKAIQRAHCHTHDRIPLDVVEFPIHPMPDIVRQDHFQGTLELVTRGLDAGYFPELPIDRYGGAYFMKDEDGLHDVAVFKPMDEDPMCVDNPKGYNTNSNPFMWMEGLKKGTKIGKGDIKEVAAYILDLSKFSSH